MQVLCSNNSDRNPAQDKLIAQALNTIPHYIEKINLAEANEDGTLAIGWQLRSTNDHALLDGLDLVQALAERRIQDFNRQSGAHLRCFALKVLLQQYAHAQGIQTASSATNTVQDIFVELQGALSPKIRHTLQLFASEPVLQTSANMLYQTASIAPASTTWLQKASESHAHHQQAQTYTASPSFKEFWLKHINVEPTPLFDHEIQPWWDIQRT